MLGIEDQRSRHGEVGFHDWLERRGRERSGAYVPRSERPQPALSTNGVEATDEARVI